MTPARTRAPEVIAFDAPMRTWVAALPDFTGFTVKLAAAGLVPVLAAAAVAFADGHLGLLDAAVLVAVITTVLGLCRAASDAAVRRHVAAWQVAVHPRHGVCEELTEAVSGMLADQGMVLLRLKAVHPLRGPSRVAAAGTDGQQFCYSFALDRAAERRLVLESWGTT